MHFLVTYYNCPKLIAPTIKFVKYLVDTIFILVPIILIVMGSLDFGKAVVAKDEGEIKKAQTIFIKRVITGVSIFFIFSLVSLVIRIVSDAVNSSTNKYSWAACWTNPMGECPIGQVLSANDDGKCVDNQSTVDNCSQYSSDIIKYEQCRDCWNKGFGYNPINNKCNDRKLDNQDMPK